MKHYLVHRDYYFWMSRVLPGAFRGAEAGGQSDSVARNYYGKVWLSKKHLTILLSHTPQYVEVDGSVSKQGVFY